MKSNCLSSIAWSEEPLKWVLFQRSSDHLLLPIDTHSLTHKTHPRWNAAWLNTTRARKLLYSQSSVDPSDSPILNLFVLYYVIKLQKNASEHLNFIPNRHCNELATITFQVSYKRKPNLLVCQLCEQGQHWGPEIKPKLAHYTFYLSLIERTTSKFSPNLL